MKKWFSFVLLVVACGGGGGNSDGNAPPDDAAVDPIDAADVTPDAPDAVGCDPLAAAGQQGCGSGLKCTWIEIQDTPDQLGMLGCVPDGTVAIGGTCTRGAAGATTGYDNCAAGGVCIGAGGAAVCKAVCGFVDGCTPGEACTRYAGLGANGDDAPVIGACNPTCDPLTQTRIVNGQTTTCGQGQGCYLLASTIDTVAVCAGAGTPTHNQPIVGTTYANSCAPGHVPRQAVQGQAGNECASLCKPADVYMGMNEVHEGGNATATNYANMPATCASAGGPDVLPGVAVTGESCQYYWTREPSANPTAFSNTLGWCFNHASWKYDPDGMDPITNTADYPRCITLTTGDVVPPLSPDPAMPQNDALYFGCTALPAPFQGAFPKPPVVKAPQLDRLRSYRE